MLLALLTLWLARPLAALESRELLDLSLEELLEVKVSLVSRKEKPLREALAAVAVITGDEIRRSGATSIAELLRRVPGMQVARIDANKWAVGARGFNSRFANKFLVQIDGRSVYTPMFSGVFWEEQDLILEDIERIEVIRGPGAALWGANAVDGIVNIVTYHADATQGTLLQGGGGWEERGFAAGRYGGGIGDDLYYRVYGKYVDRADYTTEGGQSARDAWWQGRGGFRLDWAPSGRQQLMLQGGLYDGEMDQRNQTYTPEPPYVEELLRPIEVSGGHLLGRWERIAADGSALALQLYFDWTRRWENLDEQRRTFDVDFQHRLAWGRRQELTWGGGFRTSADRMRGNNFTVRIEPDHRRIDLFSAFLQDEIRLLPERLSLTLGVKLERNDFTGVEVQPGARLGWTPLPGHVFWTALSRAVRTPSRVDDDMRFVVGVLAPGRGMFGLPGLPEGLPPLFLALSGDRDVEAETVRALEVGYRFPVGDRLLVDIAAFRNYYDRLLDAALGPPVFLEQPAPHSLLPLNTVNNIEGNSRGVEIAATVQPFPWWRLRAGYTYLHLELKSAGGTFLDQLQLDATTPERQATLYASANRGENWQFDGGLRYVAALPRLGVDGYADLELRLARQLADGFKVALVGQNLLHRRHLEFVSRFISGPPVEVERTLFAEVTWQR